MCTGDAGPEQSLVLYHKEVYTHLKKQGLYQCAALRQIVGHRLEDFKHHFEQTVWKRRCPE